MSMAELRSACATVAAVSDAPLLMNLAHDVERWRKCLTEAEHEVNVLAEGAALLTACLRRRCGLSSHEAANWLMSTSPEYESRLSVTNDTDCRDSFDSRSTTSNFTKYDE